MDHSSLLAQMSELNLGGLPSLFAAMGRQSPPSVYHAVLPPPLVSRRNYANRINTNKRERGSAQSPGYHSFAQTVRPWIVHGIAPDLMSSLKPIFLQEVASKVNHIHTDRVLFVKIIGEVFRVMATSVLVEDVHGDCIRLYLYNYVSNNAEPNTVLPVGTHLAFIAPFMKNANDNPNCELMLRCDNPNCIVRFESEEAWKNAMAGKLSSSSGNPRAFREDGNSAFRVGQYEQASLLYSRPLRSTKIEQEDEMACLGNRAESYLRMERWEDAEADARRALEMDNGNKKARFRLAKALLYLNKAKESHEIMVALNAEYPAEGWFEKFLTITARAVLEQEGKYDLDEMRKDLSLQQTPSKFRFHANFRSDHVELGVDISLLSGATYRGSRATSDLAPNTLLCASKAFAYCQFDSNRFSINSDPRTKTMSTTSQSDLENQVIFLLNRRPSLGSELYSLLSGSERDLQANDVRKVDIARIQGILGSNSFGQFPEEIELANRCKRMKLEERLQRRPTEDELESIQKDPQTSSGSGLWIKESLFNHSCVPNCSWSQIGEHMFIWSTRPIRPLEELCISYLPLDRSYKERVETFSRWTKPGKGFICQCEWCELLRQNPVLRRTERRVGEAFQKAAMMVTLSPVSMAEAAEQVLPTTERQSLLDRLCALPLHLQHNAGSRLLIVEGTCLKARGKHQAALDSYQQAAEILYATRGGRSFNRAEDLWRIVGAAMACEKVGLARASLGEVWDSFFADLTRDDLKGAFTGLTVRYALPWWQDRPSDRRVTRLRQLATDVMKGSSTKTKKSTNKKKRKNKRTS